MSKLSNVLFFIYLSVIGTLMHFIFHFTNENYYIGLIAPVSESVFEHLKMIYFPTIIYSIVELFFQKGKNKYILSASVSLILGMLAIVTFFYTYSGILGFDVMILDILAFFIGIIVLLVFKNLLMKNVQKPNIILTMLSLLLVVILGYMFIRFSYNFPNLGIFQIP